jgi:brefeldin A-resistance guanine nucleotide exchange factor 1
LRVIINILDPSDQLHTDSTRATALAILKAAFDVAGSRMGDFPSLSALLLDHGCKYLFQLARSDSPAVLSLSLRTISTMFETMRPHLKLQQELFLAFTIDRLAPPLPDKPFNMPRKGISSPRPGTPVTSSPMLKPVDTNSDLQLGIATSPRPTVAPARGETRELMLETLSQISRHPNFMVDLYANYDCDLNCENMFERLVDFLTKVRIVVGKGD